MCISLLKPNPNSFAENSKQNSAKINQIIALVISSLALSRPGSRSAGKFSDERNNELEACNCRYRQNNQSFTRVINEPIMKVIAKVQVWKFRTHDFVTEFYLRRVK